MREPISGFLIAIALVAGSHQGSAATGSLLPGDAARGLAVFQTRGCAGCHNIHGKGGNGAPDLGEGSDRSLSPYVIAGLLWNHAPAMWAAMEKSGVARPELSEQDAADLFVYFFASRYFEQPGEPKRGRQVFAQKRCAACHGIASAIREGIQPVSAWGAIENPIALAQQMWNHSGEMRRALERNRVAYPQLSAQQISDLLAYVRTTQDRGPSAGFSLGPADSGEDLIISKGCAACHMGNRKLQGRPTRYSLTDFAAAMWNHPNRASQDLAPLSYGEMRGLVGYLISAQFFEERGNQEQGRVVYQKKRCGVCHDAPLSGAPARQTMAGSMTSFGMVAALWKHGPTMLKMMPSKNISWPRFSGSEMADLTTYLRGLQLRRRPPADSLSDKPGF